MGVEIGCGSSCSECCGIYIRCLLNQSQRTISPHSRNAGLSRRKAFCAAHFDHFSDFRLGDGRTAGAILAHIGDLLDWALIMAKEKHVCA